MNKGKSRNPLVYYTSFGINVRDVSQKESMKMLDFLKLPLRKICHDSPIFAFFRPSCIVRLRCRVTKMCREILSNIDRIVLINEWLP
jgi:hypothetical protein